MGLLEECTPAGTAGCMGRFWGIGLTVDSLETNLTVDSSGTSLTVDSLGTSSTVDAWTPRRLLGISFACNSARIGWMLESARAGSTHCQRSDKASGNTHSPTNQSDLLHTNRPTPRHLDADTSTPRPTPRRRSTPRRCNADILSALSADCIAATNAAICFFRLLPSCLLKGCCGGC